MKDLPLKARVYILATVAGAAFFLIRYVIDIEFENLWLTLAICLVTSITQIVKVEGYTDKSNFNLSWILYGFSLIVLGAPQTILAILVSHIIEWLWHKYSWVVQIFNISSYILVASVTSLVLTSAHVLFPTAESFNIPIVLAALAIFTLLNHLSIGLVILFARGQGLRESGVLNSFSLMLDFTLLCLGAASAYIWSISPLASILNVIPLYLIYNTLKVPSLKRKSDTDQKTGLFNSGFFSDTIEKELSRSNRFNRPLTVVMADLDFLRDINNTYGHIAGDEVIIALANILKGSFRDYDIVSRFGGEEFAVMMPETELDKALPRVEEIRRRIEQHPFEISTSMEPIQVTMSFGVAQRDGGSQTRDQLLDNADKALYRAKLSGRNQVAVHENGKENPNTDLDIPAEKDQNHSHELPEPVMEVIQEAEKQLAREEEAQLEEKAPQGVVQSPQKETRGPKLDIKQFVGLVSIVAVILFFIFRIEFPEDWLGLVIFTVLAIIVEEFSIDIYVKKSSVSTSAVPFVAGLLLYGPIAALVIGTNIAMVAWLKNRGPLHRLIFNISNHVIGGLLCSGLVMLTRDLIPADFAMASQFVYAVLFGALLFLSTTALISTAIGIDKDVTIRIVWAQNFQWLAPIYLAMGVLGYAMVLGYQSANVLGIIAITVPVLILRTTQVQYVNRTKTLVDNLKSTNVSLVQRSKEIQRLNEDLLEVLGDVIDLRDPYVLGHSQHVARSAQRLAEELGLSPEQIETTYQAGLLHDLGKIGIPEEILQKPGKLTPEEYEVVKRHPVIAAELVEKCHALQHLVPVVRHHHEKFDGTGYPDGLRGTDIPIESRIISIVDVVDAMTSDRPYREALEPRQVIEEIIRMRGEFLDPQVVEVFLRLAISEGELFFENSAVTVAENINGRDRYSGSWIPGSVEQLISIRENAS